MIRRPGDKTPPPPGGRAAERLRMFEEARQPAPAREVGTRRQKGYSTKSRRPSQKAEDTP